MEAGQQPTFDTISGQLTSLAVQWRKLCSDTADMNTQVIKQGTAGLIALAQVKGITLTTADAQKILDQFSRLNNLAGTYFGTLTVAAAFNFDDALASARGGLTS